MTELVPKTIAESVVVLSEIILPAQTNAVGNAHGGELLKIMDSAAGACAVKHSRSITVTAGVDNVNFHAPVFLVIWSSVMPILPVYPTVLWRSR